MFDDVKCDVLLPDDRVPPGSWLQTKSLYCCLYKFTITAEGRLVFHKYRDEYEGDREVRPSVLLPHYRCVHVEDIDMDYHGDISMGALAQDGSFAEYVARFTHGQL